jgi:arylsulfatase A-like enzyme
MSGMPKSERSRYASAACFVCAVLGGNPISVASAQQNLDRTVLPIQEPNRPTYSEPDARNVKPPPRLPADHRRLFARQAEVFAGLLEHTDHEIWRFKKALEDIGALDNTLFIYIAGDNGTSAEGAFVGMYNEMTYFNGVTQKVEDLLPLIDKWGGPETFPDMAAGWAVAFDAPFSWIKQVASDFGGTRNGTVIHWPKGIKEKGGLRSQFAHVIDIASTILAAAGLPQPKSVNGTPQTPIECTSMLYTFDDATAASHRHRSPGCRTSRNTASYAAPRPSHRRRCTPC